MILKTNMHPSPFIQRANVSHVSNIRVVMPLPPSNHPFQRHGMLANHPTHSAFRSLAIGNSFLPHRAGILRLSTLPTPHTSPPRPRLSSSSFADIPFAPRATPNFLATPHLAGHLLLHQLLVQWMTRKIPQAMHLA